MLQIKKQWPLFLACTIGLLTVEQTGMLGGWPSPVLARLQAPDSPIPTTSAEGAWMATVLAAVAIVAEPAAALSMEYLGRKISILLSVIPFTVSWLIIAFAKSVTELMIGRGVAGIGLAYALTVIPVYLAEIATDDIRGGIGVFMIVFYNIGVLWMYLVGMHPQLWFSSMMAIIPMFLILIFYHWLPESPYYLIKNKRREDAVNALKKLRNNANVDNEIKKIEIIVSVNTKHNMFKEFLSEPSHRRALLVSIGTISIAQFTGGVALIMYAHLIFQKAGNISMNTLSLIKAVCQLLSSIGSAYVIDRLGRKPLLIMSCLGSAVFISCEGVYFYLLDYKYNVDSIWWLPLFAMVMFNVSQNLGLSAIYLIYMGEFFHPKVKSLSVCIAKTYLAVTVVIVGKLFQVMTDALGNSVPFFIFAGIGILGIVFVVFLVPETKGKSLDEIQYYFKNKTFRNYTSEQYQ